MKATPPNRTDRTSYADAFAVAAAVQKKALLVTSDPEYKKVEKLIKILWLK